MKKIITIALTLALAAALLLTQTALAEPSELVKNVYEALVAEGSDFSEAKALYAEYYPDIVLEARLEDNGFTISVTGNEYMPAGTWTYVQDGDYLSCQLAADDFSGAMAARYVLGAVADYYGMNDGLVNGYVSGLSMLELENTYFISARDEAAGTIEMRVYAAGPWEMKELDQMVISDAVLDEKLGEGWVSVVANMGKVTLLCNGNADEATILVGEYGGLDDLAYQSIINAVNILQPDDYEEFLAEYKELADADGDDYSVRLNVSSETVAEIIEDANPEYSYAVLRFGDAVGIDAEDDDKD